VLVCVLGPVLLGTAFASLANSLALLMRSRESVIASSLLVWPLSFLSATFMPLNLLPGWIRAVSAYHPVN
jgi:ABC-type multidrug transport system permease subunit